MKCKICEKEIELYDPSLHRMEIDQERAVDLCPACVDRILRWQSQKMATLFPTRALKKRFGKKDRN